jgi:predicted phosphate transport protein (TIGR00153 family)
MGLDSIIRWLVPREDQFYGFLEAQVDVVDRAAQALLAFHEGEPATKVRDRIQELEHEGDRVFHDMERALAQTFVTPIDREDLHRLSAELDDIVDRMNGALRAAVLLGVERPTEPMSQLIQLIRHCADQLRSAVPCLRKHKYDDMRESIGALRQLEKSADIIFRDAVSHLFRDSHVDAKQLLREREILDDLENAVDHCERVGSTLANLAVKHG